LGTATNLQTGEVLAEYVLIANTFFQRLRGLLGRKELVPGEALYIPNCSSIHTLFMWFPIDVVFLNKKGEVTKLIYALAPFRLAIGPPGTDAVLELRTGTLARVGCKRGDTISVKQYRSKAMLEGD
jgi:uncharacterized membrane protein (UPF0127 family)